MLAGASLVPLDASILTAATTIVPKNVGVLDAIHLATAVRLHQDGLLTAFMTYDERLAEGARHHGLTVVSPS